MGAVTEHDAHTVHDPVAGDHLPAGMAARVDGDHRHLRSHLPAAAQALQHRPGAVGHAGVREPAGGIPLAAGCDVGVLPQRRVTAPCHAQSDLQRHDALHGRHHHLHGDHVPVARDDALAAELSLWRLRRGGEQEIAQARALDERRAQGHAIGPLHGIPVAIKDIIDTADYPTELGSPLAAGRRPRHDATVVAKLRAAGAVIIGKSVTTEFAYYHPGPTRNPHDHAHTPGGSSSGSAAAVAAGMVPLALGTQTNGSVIRPAAFCGVFAVKPSHGLVSRAGVLALSRKLDHIGAFARSLPDLALILEVIAGHDPADPDTEPFAAPDFRAVQREPPPLPPRFAFVRTPVWDKADGDTKAAFEELAAALGSAVEPVDLPPAWAEAWEVHRTIMAAEMAHNLAPLVAHGEPSEALRKLLAHGRGVSAVDYLGAL